MSDHLVVIFAYHYPPENAVGGLRPARFAKYLSRLGYSCRVITAADQNGRNDPNTVYIPDPFETGTRRGFGWQVERAIRKVFLPGEMGMRWSYRAARAARKLIRAHQREYPGARVTILSTFPQLGTLLAGWQLSHLSGIRWIADFRDPLSEERAARGAYLQRRAYRWLERAAVRSAGAVIANTDAAKARLREKYPSREEKVRVIWNGFDPEERVVPLPTGSGECRVMSHTGELYAGRSAAPVVESMARLMAAGRLTAASVRVRFIGRAAEGALPTKALVNRARAEGWLELVAEQIPRREALWTAQSSDYLLLLQPRSATQVPGKLFEYLQIGRPILAFLERNSPSDRVLAQAGVPYRCVYTGDRPSIVDDIVADFFKLPSTAIEPNPWFEEQFNAERQTRQLDAILRSLHDEPVRQANPAPATRAAPGAPRLSKSSS